MFFFKYKMEYVWTPVNIFLFWVVMDEVIVSKSLYPEDIYHFFGWLFMMWMFYSIFHVIGSTLICTEDENGNDNLGDADYMMHKISFFVLIWLCVFRILSSSYV